MTTFTLREEYGDRYASLDEAFLAAVPILAEMIVLKREREADEDEGQEVAEGAEMPVT